MASRSVRQRFINGKPQRIGYLSQLRIAATHRHLTRRILRDGFRLLNQTRAADEMPFDITTIVADNTVARRILEAGLPELPQYAPLERIVTMLLPTCHFGRIKKSHLCYMRSIARATPITLCQDQFAPVWSDDELAQMNEFRILSKIRFI